MHSTKPSQSMNVLYISQHKDFLGGAERSLYELIKNIDSQKVKAHFASPYDGDIAKKIKKLGVPFLKLDVFPTKRPHILVSNTLKLIFYLIKNNIHIIHNNQCIDAQYSWLAGKITRTPIIIHHRDSKYYGIDKWLTNRVDCNISISTSHNDQFLEGKGIVIQNAIELNKFPNSPPIENSDNTNQINIGIIGRISPIKGQDVFIKAAKIVVSKVKSVEFRIIGDIDSVYYPEYKAELHSLIKEYNLEEFVKFGGYIPDPVEAFSTIDISVCASTREPFGRVIIESMACFKPVITTPVGAALEKGVDKVALYFPIGDEKALADSILKLINDRELRHKISLSARRLVEKDYSITKLLSKLYLTYEKINTDVHK